MNKKILTIMVILVVVLVMGASILFFNQKNKKISDANILTNIEKEIRIEAQKTVETFIEIRRTLITLMKPLLVSLGL